MNHTTRYLSVLIFGIAVGTAQSAPAQEAPETREARKANAIALIERLGVDDLDAREHATETLMLFEELRDEVLAVALRESKGEKHERLVNIAMHHFYKRLSEGPRLMLPSASRHSGIEKTAGAMGIETPDTNLIRADQHEGLEHAGWLITGRWPGFPGFVHLRKGDIITGMENQPFTDDLDQGHFIDMIQKYRLNETMTLNVLRRNKHIVVKMVIGSKERLMNVAEKVYAETKVVANGYQRPQMYEPWRNHLQKLLGEKTP